MKSSYVSWVLVIAGVVFVAAALGLWAMVSAQHAATVNGAVQQAQAEVKAFSLLVQRNDLDWFVKLDAHLKASNNLRTYYTQAWNANDLDACIKLVLLKNR